jgi:hypothetical protein
LSSSSSQFPELYKCYEEGEPSIPLPDLVMMFLPFGWREKQLAKKRVKNLKEKAPKCTKADVAFGDKVSS